MRVHASRLTRRFLAASATAILIGNVLSPLAPASAATPAKAGDGTVVVKGAASPYVVPAVAAPIAPHDAGTGAGTSTLASAQDPSIQPRPRIPATVAPHARTEVVSARSEHSRTFANPDGTYTQEISEGRMNYQDASGAWQLLDLTLVPDAAGAFSERVAANDSTVRFATASGDAGLAQVSNGATTMTIRTLGYGAGSVSADPNGVADGVAFPGQGSAATVTAQPTDTGFEFGASWADSQGSSMLQFVLDPGDPTLSVSVVAGAVLVSQTTTDATGASSTTTVGRINPPILTDGTCPASRILDTPWLG